MGTNTHTVTVVFHDSRVFSSEDECIQKILADLTLYSDDIKSIGNVTPHLSSNPSSAQITVEADSGLTETQITQMFRQLGSVTDAVYEDSNDHEVINS